MSGSSQSTTVLRVWGTPNSWIVYFMENTTCGRVLGAGRGLPTVEEVDNPDLLEVLDVHLLDAHRQPKLR